MTRSALALSGLEAGYGQVRVLEDISFDVPRGARVAVLGRNGMGKTTLLATLMGLTRRFGGSIRLGGREIGGLSSSTRASLGLGYVPQTRDIFASLTVEENLLAGLKGRPRSALDEAYRMFPRLAERRGNLGVQLSGGEQQMLTTARTLLGRPSVLLLDEPLEGLAPVICDELMASLEALTADRAMTTILVEQQIERALDYADTVFVIEYGRIAWRGEAQAMRGDPGLVDRYLGVGVH